MARVAVIIFSSDEAEMRLRSAIKAAQNGHEADALAYLQSAVRDGFVEIGSSWPVVPR